MATETHGIHPSLAPLAVPIGDLRPDPKNARLHGERSLDEIEASYREHGQRKPVVVQRVTDAGLPMVVRSGNGQLEAARRLGWTHLAAVVVDERDREAVAFALRDNRTAEASTWDYQVLRDELADFAGSGVDTDSLGWTGGEVIELIGYADDQADASAPDRGGQVEDQEDRGPGRRGRRPAAGPAQACDRCGRPLAPREAPPRVR